MAGDAAGTPSPGRAALRRLTDPVLVGTVAAPLAAAVFTVLFVVPTLLPGLWHGDAAEFQTVGPLMGTAHPTGYPSYIILGWLASVVLQPFGEPAFRMNLLQALLTAGAAAGAAGIVQVLTGRRFIALATGLLMVVTPFFATVSVDLPRSGFDTTPLFMRLATHADPHMLHVALVALIFVLLLVWDRRRRNEDADVSDRADRWLVAAAMVYGVALTNHSLTLLLPPAIGIFVLMADWRVIFRWRTVTACMLGLAATAILFWLELPIRAAMNAPLVYGHPDSWGGFQYVVLAKQFGGDLRDPLGALGTKAGEVAAMMTSWLGPLILVAAIGVGTSLVRRPRYVVLSGLSALATCLFSTSYANSDIERYFLVPLLVAFTFVGLALADLTTAASEVASLLRDRFRPESTSDPGARREWSARFLLVAEIVLAAVLVTPLGVAVAARQQPKSDFSPGSVSEASLTEDSQWMHAVLAPAANGGLPKDAVIESFWYPSTELWYGQKVEGLRPDVLIIDDSTRKNDHIGANGEVWDVFDTYLGKRPVFTARQGGGCDGFQALSTAFDLKPSGLTGIYQVLGRVEPRVSLGPCDPFDPKIQ